MEELNMVVIFTYVVLCVIIISLGTLINYKVYSNINDEEFKEKGKIIQRIVKNYCMVQCFAWPFILVLFGIVCTVIRSPFILYHPEMTVTSIHLAEFIISFVFLYVGFNSFIIGLCRYVFIIIINHNDTSTIKMIRKLVFAASIAAPTILTILDLTFLPLPEKKINLMPQHIEMMKTMMFNNSGYEIENDTWIIPRSTFYTVAHDVVPQFLLHPIQCVLEFITFSACSNVIEGGFYIHIFWYKKR